MDTREHFALALSRLSRAWRTRLDERLKGLGLTQARWMTLLQLSRLGDGIRQGELAGTLAVEGPTLVRLLDRLEELGLVERRPDIGGDRRVKRVFLTSHAKPLLKEIDHVAAELRREIMAEVDPADLRTCLRVFGIIEKRLERE